MRELNERLFGAPTPNPAAIETLRELRSERDFAVRQYVEGLPRLVVGRCPFCERLTRRTVDVFGLDGPWWNVHGPDTTPEACEHYLVTLGALNFLGQDKQQAVRDSKGQIEPGPEVPFIVPRLMRLGNVRCVICAHNVDDSRFTIFCMSYYADPPLPAELGVQPWPRNVFYFRPHDRHAERHVAWSSRDEERDFEIADWIDDADQRVGWLAPGDEHSALMFRNTSGCPFIGVPGSQADISIREGRLVVHAAEGGK
jgi:hypothetical protein